jgi:hypothetical protein
MSLKPLRSNEHALTALEAAEMLGIHVNTIKRIPPEDLPYFVATKRGDRRYMRETIRLYISDRMVGAA